MSKMNIYVQDETAEVIKRLVQNDAAKVTNLKNKDEINRIYIHNRPMSETRRQLSHYQGWKPTFDGRRPLREDDLRGKTTFDGRQPLIEDDYRWKTTFYGRRTYMKTTFND